MLTLSTRIVRIGLASLIAQISLMAVLPASASAQLPNEEYRGVTATGLMLRKLATTKRVLVIAAHPDDEDNQLLTMLSLGDGEDVAYLSLTRGEGGQNSIGGELGPALGVLRTGELLAARSEDGALQYFTRAYDFGFSKTAEESLQHWPRDSVLADVVWIVRKYRPDVIVAIFTGTPTDGHGQHQVSGLLAREAFVAAADASRFPEQIRAGLHAYRTPKLFQATGYNQGTPSERFQTGTLDPLFGRSYSQLAAFGRSRHRSQDTGQAQTVGPHLTSVRLLQSNVATRDSMLFSGIDTTLSARAASAHESAPVVTSLQRYDSLISAAQSRLSAYESETSAQLLGAAVRELTTATSQLRNDDLRFKADAELALAQRALLQSSGVIVDAISDVELITPGSTFNLDVTVWNAGNQDVQIAQLEPALPEGWHFERIDTANAANAAVTSGNVSARRFRVSVPQNAAIDQPYFLAKHRNGDLYAWPSTSAVAGEPYNAPPVQVNAMLNVRGTAARQTVVATRRVVDPRQGELRRALHVAPAFALKAEPATSVITLASLASGTKWVDVSVEVSSNGVGGTVTVKPVLPAGWRAQPDQTTAVVSAHQSQGLKFRITPPRTAAAGQYDIRMVATDSSGRSYDMQQRIVDYPHIVNQVMFEPANVHVTILDAKFARGLRVGYIVGIDAPVPDVLEQMGVSVDRLDENALASSDLSKYDAIVVGSRAYQVRPDLVTHNNRVLDYARNGGNVLTLYQQYEFIAGKYAPFPLTIARPHDRITNENSPVRMLDSTALVLTRPNRITQNDFLGWLQERTLYMPHTWAPEYKPLLEMSDPGEAPQQGAIVTAPLGRGTYTYTGISFLREIPEGVPGALRLFVNLLSLGVKDVAF